LALRDSIIHRENKIPKTGHLPGHSNSLSVVHGRVLYSLPHLFALCLNYRFYIFPKYTFSSRLSPPFECKLFICVTAIIFIKVLEKSYRRGCIVYCCCFLFTLLFWSSLAPLALLSALINGCQNMEEHFSRVPRLSDTRYSDKGTKGKCKYASRKARLKGPTYPR